MPRKSKRSNKKGNKLKKTRKQKVYVMRGCSKNPKSCNHNHKKGFLTLGNKDCPNCEHNCPNCGPNCQCGPNCNCPHPCPGTCKQNNKLNRKLTRKLTGGSGCGSCGCPIAPLSLKQMNMFGGHNEGLKGGCGSCAMKGGNFFKPASFIPGPIVGSAWGASFNKLPGSDGVGGDRNFLKPFNSEKDPQLQMSMNDAGYNTMNSKVGGSIKGKKGRKYRSNFIKGGGLIPQDLVNLGSNFSFNLKSAYNSLNGYKAPIDPLPYKDQLTQNNKILL